MTEEEALQRALQRERKRRRSAELLLEEKSRELFESFEALEKAHRSLLQNQKQLIYSEKMASLGIMSAGIAHEINTPVSYALSNLGVLGDRLPVLTRAIEGSRVLLESVEHDQALVEKISCFQSELAKRDVEFLLADAPDLLAETVNGLQRIRDIVVGLKSFAQADGSERISLDVNQILREAVAVIHSELPADVKVLETYGQIPELVASRSSLRRVFLNVLLNACEAMSAIDRPDHELSIQSSSIDGNICISVSDTGSGMTDETQEKLFTPFYTTKEVGEGMGLGLSVSLGIIEDHGGRIEFDSEPGVGSRFDLIF